MRTSRHLPVAGVSACLILSITACSGGTSATVTNNSAPPNSAANNHSASHAPASDGGGTTGAASVAPAGNTTDLTKKPCDLITLADANKALGVTLVTKQSNVEISGINYNCVYQDANGHRVQVVVSEAPQTVDQLTQFSSHAATEVPGVGDKAYWNHDMATIFVSDHNVGYSVGVFDDHLTLGDAKVKAAATALGKIAAGRLG